MSDMGDEIHDLVHAFADGELEPTEAEAFRTHLGTCERCQAELNDIRQLQALSGRLAKAQAPQKKEEAPSNVIRPTWGRRRTALTVVMGGAVAFAVAMLRTPGGSRDGEGSPTLALAPTRSLEARLSYGAASGWRPYNVKRSGNEPALELVPLETLSRLEKAGDYHGMATGYLLRGEGEQAASALGRVSTASPDVDSDRAVVALSKGSLEEALAILEGVLEKAPNHAPALWNRGLVLRELGLDLLAAQSFARVAALNEPGWSDEARERQAALERQSPRSAYPEMPPVPEPINLDTWGFASTPLFPRASSIYLTGFESPTDATRIYVYGVDVAQGKFLFAGTLDKRHVSQLLQRTVSDIEALKSSGSAQPLGGVALQPDGPPPRPPDTQELGVQSFAQRGWRLAVEADQVARKLRR
jgi:tetratricopeptide (TPR) repeat protein